MTECGCLSSPLQAAGHSGIFCKERLLEKEGFLSFDDMERVEKSIRVQLDL
jgi:hypothetical protein